MTLIDLPGITRNPQKSQPINIEEILTNLSLEYIKNPKCIILAVSPANNDISNSDAIQLAQKVDKEQTRTLGVLTKIDLMDEGTDCKQVLLGNIIPLRLGYFGVINQSQKEVESKQKISDKRLWEVQWFERNSIYKSIKSKCGVGNLASQLSKLLNNHINRYIPDVQRDISNKYASTQKDIQELREKYPYNPDTPKSDILIDLSAQFIKSFLQNYEGLDKTLTQRQLKGAAKLRKVFRESLQSELDFIDVSQEIDDVVVLAAIKNVHGLRGDTFFQQEPFDMLCKKYIKRLETPALICIDTLEDQFKDIIECSEPQSIGDSVNLKPYFQQAAQNYFSDCFDEARRAIKYFIECEVAYMNTDTKEFQEFYQSISSELDQEENEEDEEIDWDQNQNAQSLNPYQNFANNIDEVVLNQDNQRQVKLIKKLFEAYFNIVKRDLTDKVPKIFARNIVNRIKEDFPNAINKQVISEQDVLIVSESPDTVKEKKDLQEYAQVLRQAKKEIEKVMYMHQ